MKLPTPNVLRTMDGLQWASQECYAIAMKEPKAVCVICAPAEEPEPGSPTVGLTLRERPKPNAATTAAEHEKSIPSAEELEGVPIKGSEKTINLLQDGYI